MGQATVSDRIAERNESLVQLALRKIGIAFCPHSFLLAQHRDRLFVRCADCGLETVGIATGERPDTRTRQQPETRT